MRNYKVKTVKVIKASDRNASNPQEYVINESQYQEEKDKWILATEKATTKNKTNKPTAEKPENK
ncbi:MAG: hypothetical protein QNJ54_01535 [Prochloraceae cyanobacterium]|nr:hypothetical protein [Prochloraceae cyanobacterium]